MDRAFTERGIFSVRLEAALSATHGNRRAETVQARQPVRSLHEHATHGDLNKLTELCTLETGRG